MHGSLDFHCIIDETTPNDSFDKSSKELFGYFNYELARNDFVLGSKGHGLDQAYGYAHCYYGVYAKDCQTCMAEAANESIERCPYRKQAVMLYENCVLKYSDVSFFGIVDEYQLSRVLPRAENSSSPEEFNAKKKQLLGNLSGQVSRTPRFMATGDFPVDGSTKLYGLAQCTRDLSSLVCQKCLDGAISKNQASCTGKLGARVLTASSIMRYQVYKFYN
ncbi:Gnk2-like domain containing protein [Parasponia andersonii]|uniref:Gnk2-like domain containing protein n=1 Tax=Parasponia andersonii TaxID=3476 RepID=A0A2P5BIT6_PARAD|nr:Gnk2-like domain containing protein [Parasponia andersonii]